MNSKLFKTKMAVRFVLCSALDCLCTLTNYYYLYSRQFAYARRSVFIHSVNVQVLLECLWRVTSVSLRVGHFLIRGLIFH